jgi:hypothetical protein
MKKHELVYYILTYLLYTLYFLLYIGFEIYEIPEYLELLNIVTRLYVSIILIIKFNPFTSNTKFSNFDRDIVFKSGVLLLTTIGLTGFRDIYYHFNKK